MYRELGVIIMLIILAIHAHAEVYSLEIYQKGKEVKVVGTASENSSIEMEAEFNTIVSVDKNTGKYKLEFYGVYPPKQEGKERQEITLLAEPVQSFALRIEVFGLGKEWDFPVVNGTSTWTAYLDTAISELAQIVSGILNKFAKYKIILYGVARPKATSVNITIKGSQKIQADEHGNFAIIVDTTGYPVGWYKITARSNTTIISKSIELTSPSKTPTPIPYIGQGVRESFSILENGIATYKIGRFANLTPIIEIPGANGTVIVEALKKIHIVYLQFLKCRFSNT